MAMDLPDEPGIKDAKAHLSDYVNRVIYRDEIVWVTKNGKRVAALVPVEVAERYERESAEGAGAGS
jgi:prevent-host-death family protein